MRRYCLHTAGSTAAAVTHGIKMGTGMKPCVQVSYQARWASRRSGGGGYRGKPRSRQSAVSQEHPHATIVATTMSSSASVITQKEAGCWEEQVGLNTPTFPTGATTPPVRARIPKLPPWVPIPISRQTLSIRDSPNLVGGRGFEVAHAGLPTNLQTQRPLHVVIVMDVSGSMGASASKRNAAGHQETFANCVLDLVKYAALAVSKMLNKDDFYSLVVYSSTASLLLDHVPGDQWELISRMIADIKPSGITDLGGGLRKALDCVVRNWSSDSEPESCPQNAVFLLTDGAPNAGVNAASVLGTFARSDSAALSNTIVNTYAFGYAHDLASELMFEIAAKGNGSFSYIPDVGFLGTVFIHALANLRAVVGVVPSDGIKGVSCGQVRCGIANVKFNAPRRNRNELNTNMASAYEAPKSITGTTTIPVTLERVQKALKGKDFGPGLPVEVVVAREILRSVHAQKVCNCILQCIGEEGGEEPSEKSFKDLLEAANVDIGAVPHLAFDIEQQVAPAFRPEYYNRWGKHYLLSFASAHINQQCNNFKDKSIAGYKTAYIANKHDQYDDIFNMLEPPQPTNLNSGQRGGVVRTTIISNSQINNSRDPCVHEDSQVRMGDGSLKAAKDVRPGDAVATFSGLVVKIDRIIRTQCRGGKVDLICFPPPSFAHGFYNDGECHHEGLRITPWHPVLTQEVNRSGSSRGPPIWKLPCDTGLPIRSWKCEHLYSFCVEPPSAVEDALASSGYEPAMMIDGVAVVYLAHGRMEPPLLKHAFFGTPRVLEQLPRGDGCRTHTFAPEPVIKDNDEDDHSKATLRSLGIPAGDGLACAWDLRKLVKSE